MKIDSRHSFRHSSESWNPEGVGRGKTTRRWKKPTRHPAIFIPLCGLRKPMVIPAYKGARYDALIPDMLDLPCHWRTSSPAMRQLIEDCR